jgi:hypothetical protein
MMVVLLRRGDPFVGLSVNEKTHQKSVGMSVWGVFK